MAHFEGEVRRQVLKALHARDPEWVERALPELAQDPFDGVRFLVLQLAEEDARRDVLTAIAEDDTDAYIRGLATHALGRLAPS